MKHIGKMKHVTHHCHCFDTLVVKQARSLLIG